MEHHLLDEFPDRAMIVRLTKIVHPDLDLITNWRATLNAGTPVHPFADLVIAPISLQYLAASLLMLVNDGARRLCHLSGVADLSYADLCMRLCAGWGYDPKLVVPRASSATAQYFQYRPRFAALGMHRTRTFGVMPCPIEYVL